MNRPPAPNARDSALGDSYVAKGLPEVVRKNLKRLVLSRVGADKEFKTQEQFAVWHGIAKSTLSQVLNSKRSPKLETIEQLCCALKEPPERLMRVPEPRPQNWDEL